MKKQIANEGAKKVLAMIKDGKSIHRILNYANGWGFDTDNPSAAVFYSRENNRLAVTYRNKTSYHYL